MRGCGACFFILWEACSRRKVGKEVTGIFAESAGLLPSCVAVPDPGKAVPSLL